VAYFDAHGHNLWYNSFERKGDFMKKFLLPVLCVALFAACDKKSEEDVIVQTCGNYTVEIKMTDGGEKLYARINGDAVEMTNVVAASGAKFDGVLNDTNVSLWNKGADWIMLIDDETLIECTAK